MTDSRLEKLDSSEEFARTVVYGEAAISYIKGHKTPAYPRNYELWYTYAAGYNRELNNAINDILKSKKLITPDCIEEFYEQYLSPLRHADRIGRVGENVSNEVGSILTLIDQASGNASEYGESLESAASNLSDAGTQTQIKAVVDRILSATSDMREKNDELERQLYESRQQIVELQSNLETIRFESMTDELTGLANRRHFDDALSAIVSSCHLSGSPLTLVMCDIDHFKRFNDTYGHQTGDQVLKLVSSSIKMTVKGKDVAARYGGEEFAIVLPDTTIMDASTVAEHIRVSIKSKELVKRSTGENLGNVTMSFGVAQLRPGETPDMLIERADMCLYASKRNGRNRVTLEDDPLMGDQKHVA